MLLQECGEDGTMYDTPFVVAAWLLELALGLLWGFGGCGW